MLLMKSKYLLLAGVAAVSLSLAGCGDDAKNDNSDKTCKAGNCCSRSNYKVRSSKTGHEHLHRRRKGAKR